MLAGVVIFSGTTDFDGTPPPIAPSPPPQGDVFDGTTEQSFGGGNGGLGTGGTIYPPGPTSSPPTIPPDPNTLVLTASPNSQSTSGLYEYFSQFSIATGGIAPYSYSIVGGALPPGTALETSNGTPGNIATVAGVTTASGPYSYTVQAQDSTGLLTFTPIGFGGYGWGGPYDGVAGNIATFADNQLIMIVCVTGRDDTSFSANEVTTVNSNPVGLLTFTRVFHDTFTYTDSAADAPTPVASFSIDIFTAPAPTQITTPISWRGTLSNASDTSSHLNGMVQILSIGGLTSLSAPFDPGPGLPNVASNATGTASAPTNTGVSTTNAADALFSLIINHDTYPDATAVPPPGFTAVTNKNSAGWASGFNMLLSFQDVKAVQNNITVTAGFSDNYWYSAIFALEGGGGTPLTAQQTVTGNISPVVPGTATITLSTPNTNNPTGDPVFIVPPYNTLTCELYGGSATATVLYSTFGLTMTAPPNGYAKFVFTPATPGAPPEAQQGQPVMPYTIGTGSPAGEIIFTWS